MIDRDSPVTADELHAYVDGLLPAERTQAIEAWLATHPDDAAQVAEWRTQAASIRARYGVIATQPPPARFNLDRCRVALAGTRRRRVQARAGREIAATRATGLAGLSLCRRRGRHDPGHGARRDSAVSLACS